MSALAPLRAVPEEPRLRLPTHSVEAEQSVLGALLLENTAWERVVDLINEQDFYRADHKAIYRQIVSQIQAGKAADVVTVAETLESAGTLDQAGGLSYLATLVQNTPSAANIRRYAEIVRDKARRRRLAALVLKLADTVACGGDTAALLDQIREHGENLGERRDAFRLLSAADLAAIPRSPQRVAGIAPATGLVAIFGPSGSGKSFFAHDMVGAIATGREWFGNAVTRCPCIYVVLEGEAGIAQRALAYSSRHGPADGLSVVLPGTFDVRDARDRAGLAKSIQAAGMAGGVVVLDTLNRAAPGLDENDSSAMGQVIAGLKALQAELGGLVVVVHHAGKDPTRGMRGHSSLFAALDVVLEVTRDGDRREWRLAKAKDGQDGKAHPFRLDVVELGEDAEGWPVTSCVVEPEEQAGETVSRASLPRGGNQRIVWDGLGELLRGSKDFGQAGAPPTRPCIKLEDAIHFLRGRLTCEPDRQTERTRAAFTALIARGLVHHREGWLWLS